MKKVLLASALMLCAMSFKVQADMVKIPRAEPQAVATADYAGVLYSTSAFPVSGASTNFSTACAPCSGVWYGEYFSSGSTNAMDFVDVYDASSTVNAVAIGPFARVYNTSPSSATLSSAGFQGPPKPIRFSKGLITRASTAVYNMITTLFYSTDALNQ